MKVKQPRRSYGKNSWMIFATNVVSTAADLKMC
jgi:hypothetical protein